MKLAIHRSEPVHLIRYVSLEDFNWNDQSVLKQIVEDLAVEDVDTAIITATCEEGIFVTIVYLSDCFIVIFKVFVRRPTHVHVEPDDLLIVGTEDEVVTLRMNG